MSKQAYAVIGGNWGDEGKGLAVDAYAHRFAEIFKKDVTVVRSNGGAQAGHGVTLEDGRRHVFHHVGSGTFAGAATHLSRFFVAHPMVLQQELEDLAALGVAPRKITIDPRAYVTTPWDMAINQALEISRDQTGRHGSTGLGFGETIEREENGYPFTAVDMISPEAPALLKCILEEWVPKRLAKMGIDPEESPLADVLTGRIPLIERFLDDCAAFMSAVTFMDDKDLGAEEMVLFEGAQGLQLDMDWGAFPYVTRSNTGIKNMLEICKEAGIEDLQVTYMTRAYATRHGEGPLPFEVPDEAGIGRINWAEIVDLTNAHNEWQGTIREAPLDTDLLMVTVAKDLALSEGSGIKVSAGLGITCLDQITGQPQLVRRGKLRDVSLETMEKEIARGVGLPVFLTSRHPSRKRVEFFDFAEELALT